MDKEMMAKVNEVLKTNGKRELSMDELDKVVGGSFSYSGGDTCVLNGQTMTIGFFNSLFINMAENWDYRTARDVLRDATGFTCTEMRDQYVWGDDKSDGERMYIVLDRFWRVYRDGANW